MGATSARLACGIALVDYKNGAPTLPSSQSHRIPGALDNSVRGAERTPKGPVQVSTAHCREALPILTSLSAGRLAPEFRRLPLSSPPPSRQLDAYTLYFLLWLCYLCASRF